MDPYNKDLLRKKYKHSIRNNPELDAKIIYNLSKLVSSLKSVNTIGVYYPLKHEVDIRPLIDRYKGKIFALPKIENLLMYYTKYSKEDRLVKGRYNILVTANDNIVTPDLVVIPGIAFDLEGFRVGHGKGYYDRYLENSQNHSSIIKIGVCYNDQIHPKVNSNRYDIPMNYIITDNDIYVSKPV